MTVCTKALGAAERRAWIEQASRPAVQPAARRARARVAARLQTDRSCSISPHRQKEDPQRILTSRSTTDGLDPSHDGWTPGLRRYRLAAPLRSPQARADTALSHYRNARASILRRTARAGHFTARLRAGRVRSLPSLWRALRGLFTREMHGLLTRGSGRIFVQTSRILSVMQCPAHGRDRRPLSRSCVSVGTGSPMGVVIPLVFETAVRCVPRPAHARARCGHPGSIDGGDQAPRA
jgi:hypothetical protein